MNLLAKAQHNIGNILTIPNSIKVLAKSYLQTSYGPAVTSINVQNTAGFLANTAGVIGGFGTENAELIAITAITDQDTLAVSSTFFPHVRGDAVLFLEYDQFLVEKATSISGPWSTLGTYSVQVNQQESFIYDSVGTPTSYYRITLRNSVTTLTSSPSDPFSPETYVPDSVGQMFESVKELYGVQESDGQITTKFLLSALNDGRNVVNNRLFNFKQAWRQEFEFPIQLKAGWNYIDLPDDYEQSDTNAMLLSVRFPRINGMSPYPLSYIDKREWNTTAYSLKYSYLATDILIGATTIQLENVGDFQSNGGTIFIATNNFSEQILAVNYTGINFSTSTLTGVTGVTRNIAKGTQVFGFPTYSSATYYTVFDNKIWFNRPVPDVLQGKNVFIDYYKKLVPVNNINEVLPEPYKDIYHAYIKWCIKYRKDPTINPKNDPDAMEFQSNIQYVIDNYYTGQYPKIVSPYVG